MLEYCAGGDLFSYIQRYGKVSEVVARHFMRQLGLCSCHFIPSIAHGNLDL